jgi:PAN domain
MKPLQLVSAAVMVLAFWSGQAHPQSQSIPDICKRPNATQLGIQLADGFRVSFLLTRDGSNIRGRAQAWQINGITAGRGLVTGQFGGIAPVGQGYWFQVYWENRKDLGWSWFKGYLHEGEGEGTASNLSGRIGPVNTTTTTYPGCERWPEQFSTTGVVRASSQAEPNFDRPRGDYRNFELATSSYELCRTACETEQRCRAYTYVKPGVQGAKARCWLKDTVFEKHASDCCVSGVIRTTISEPSGPATMAPGLPKKLGKLPSVDAGIDYGGAPTCGPGQTGTPPNCSTLVK